MTRIDLDIVRGDTFAYTFPQTDTTGAANVWFTLKNKQCKLDADSIVQVDLLTGLLIVNGIVSSSPASASIAINGREITVTIAASVMAQIPREYPLVYDVQLLQGADIRTAFNGRFANIADVTRLTESAAFALMLWPEGDPVLWPDGTAVLWP